jgi:CDK inhibitor PHO81
VEHADVYGRSALHYASMNGHTTVCRHLLDAGVPPDGADNYNPLIHAIRDSIECVKVLLSDSPVSIAPAPNTADLIPLSLACQFG